MTDLKSMEESSKILHIKYDEIKVKFNDLVIDELRQICRENEITGFSTLNKQGLITLINEKYGEVYKPLSEIKYGVLYDICLENKLVVKASAGASKDLLIHILINVLYIKNNLIKHEIITNQTLDSTTKECILQKIKTILEDKKKLKTDKKKSKEVLDSSNNIITSEIDKAKQKLDELLEEKKKQDDMIKKQEKLLEKKKKQEEAEEKKKKQEEAEEKKRVEEEEKEKKRIEEVEIPPKYEELINNPLPKKNRQTLPKSVRDSVWNHYIGEDINKHRCLCCKKVLINNRQFEVGHVLSVRDCGTDEINNLRPICSPCNHSMGTTNMIEFVKTYGYYIG
jgi:flagellar biosynthesis GTPase FlhF